VGGLLGYAFATILGIVLASDIPFAQSHLKLDSLPGSILGCNVIASSFWSRHAPQKKCEPRLLVTLVAFHWNPDGRRRIPDP
jgi:hypothetical protein